MIADTAAADEYEAVGNPTAKTKAANWATNLSGASIGKNQLAEAIAPIDVR